MITDNVLKEALKDAVGCATLSEYYIGMYTPYFIHHPYCMLEFAVAVLLDKPIILIANRRHCVPRNLLNVATRVEFYDEDVADSLETLANRVGAFLKGESTECLQ